MTTEAGRDVAAEPGRLDADSAAKMAALVLSAALVGFVASPRCDAILKQQSPLRNITFAKLRAAPIMSESLAVTTAKATLGIAAQPVALASLFTLTTTGCGLPGELAGTLEGLAYTVIAGFVLGSLYTRVTTGLGMGAAELEAAAAEMEQLEQIGATEQKKAFSAQKAEDLANGPAGLLDAAERASLVTAAVAVVVVGFQLAVNGGLPSAVPNGGVCWS